MVYYLLNNLVIQRKEFMRIIQYILVQKKMFLLLPRVSLIRPAPAELPQDRKVARVGGCSGAI